MIDDLVDPSGRTLLAGLVAALGNMALLIVWISGLDGLFELLSGDWGDNPLGSFASSYVMTFLVTAFGLALLILIMAACPVPSNRLVAQISFVATGGLLGAGIGTFVLVALPALFGAYGALTASIFVNWSLPKISQ